MGRDILLIHQTRTAGPVAPRLPFWPDRPPRNPRNRDRNNIMIRIGLLLMLLMSMALSSGCGVYNAYKSHNAPDLLPMPPELAGVDPEKEKARMDDLARQLKTALAAGKSVVISPIFTKDAYHQGFRGEDGLDVLWENPNQAGGSYSLTWLRATQIRVDGRDYLVSVEEPGRYSLKVVNYQARDANLDGMKRADKPVASRGLGVTYLSSGSYKGHEWTQEWQDEISWNDRPRLKTYCTPTMGGHCIPHNVMESRKRVMREAGYHTTVKEVAKPAVDVATVLDRDFAAFDLSAGEVVMIDGVFAKPPNNWFVDDACVESSVAGILQCELRGFTMQRLRPSMDAFRQGLSEPALSPNRRARQLNLTSRNYSVPSETLAKLLSSATYQQVHFSAKPGEVDEAWGQTYYLNLD